MKKSYRTIIHKVKFIFFLLFFVLAVFTPTSPHARAISIATCTQSALNPAKSQIAKTSATTKSTLMLASSQTAKTSATTKSTLMLASSQTAKTSATTKPTAFFGNGKQLVYNGTERLAPALMLQAATTEDLPHYARILDEDTVFYSDPGCTLAKFTLPYGYFVKILHEGESSIAVRYMDDSTELPAREGFILTKHYYPYTEENVRQPYPDCRFALGEDEVIFSDNQATNPKAVLPSQTKCAFYGYWKINGEIYYCVYSNGYIGYVRKQAFINAEVPDNPLPIKRADESSDFNGSTTDDSAIQFSANETTPYTTNIDSAVKTVIVLAVSLVALSVVYLLFKPNRKNHYRPSDKNVDDLL